MSFRRARCIRLASLNTPCPPHGSYGSGERLAAWRCVRGEGRLSIGYRSGQALPAPEYIYAYRLELNGQADSDARCNSAPSVACFHLSFRSISSHIYAGLMAFDQLSAVLSACCFSPVSRAKLDPCAPLSGHARAVGSNCTASAHRVGFGEISQPDARS